MDVSCLIGGIGRQRRLGKADVKGESERAAYGRDTVNNVGTVDGAAIPSICGSMGGFNENSHGATIIGSNGNSFLQKAMEFFNAHDFVITASGDMMLNVEQLTDFSKETLETTAIVDDNEAAESNLEEDFLNKEAREIMGGDIVSSSDKNKTGKVTHGVHQVSFAAVVGDIARRP
jgi:hypothetical protein